MKYFLTISAFIAGLYCSAQIDSVGKRIFGVTGFAQGTGQFGNLNTDVGAGYGFGLFTRKEIDERNHHLFELTYEKTAFTETWTQFDPDQRILFELFYFKLLAERGTEITKYFRFNYGIHFKLLASYEGHIYSSPQFAGLNPIDFGLNLGLTYYATEQVSIGIRFNQGFINTFQQSDSIKHLSGLNWALGVYVHAGLF